MSPLYKSFPPFDAEQQADVTPTDKQRANKSKCPCQASSEGKEWLFKCTRCLQHWHATCSNLKGANQVKHGSPQQATLDLILHSWLCPWCFTTNYPKPSSSTSAKIDKSLKDSVDYSQNIQAISDAISNAVTNSIPTVEITSLETRLMKLSEEIHQFQKSRNPESCNVIGVSLEQKPVLLPKNIEIPIKDYQTGILEEDNLNDLTTFLNECKNSNMFEQKHGRSVLKFGESYNYTGDSSSPSTSEIPAPLAAAIDKVTSHCKLTHRPNSVLVNYYPPLGLTTDSSLPMHSDDEPEILADSEISTISIGDTRQINFKPIHEPRPSSPKHMEQLCPESNSVYIMTRSSQAWFKHGMSSTTTTGDTSTCIGRFSITLRTVDKKFKRSTIILGDSNTKPIQFGSGAGTMGQSFPGKRAKANTVSAIDPRQCIGYSNAVLVCGTNDLRPENLRGPEAIHQLVDILHMKIQQIKKICPKIKVFVSAVLPTRLPQMNKNIMCFNRLVGEMLRSNFNNNIWHIGVGHFLDNRGLLAMKLTRNGDDIHLGNHGLAKFVRCLKHWVYVRERQERVWRRSNQSVGVDPT